MTRSQSRVSSARPTEGRAARTTRAKTADVEPASFVFMNRSPGWSGSSRPLAVRARGGGRRERITGATFAEEFHGAHQPGLASLLDRARGGTVLRRFLAGFRVTTR